MQVGTTKDQGLYNKPLAAVHPGALAAGTLPQYNTVLCLSVVNGYGLTKTTVRCFLNVYTKSIFCAHRHTHHTLEFRT